MHRWKHDGHAGAAAAVAYCTGGSLTATQGLQLQSLTAPVAVSQPPVQGLQLQSTTASVAASQPPVQAAAVACCTGGSITATGARAAAAVDYCTGGSSCCWRRAGNAVREMELVSSGGARSGVAREQCIDPVAPPRGGQARPTHLHAVKISADEIAVGSVQILGS